MYHISDLRKFERCERLYFYDLEDAKEFRPYLRADESLIDLLIKRFNIDNCFEGVRFDENDHFLKEKDNFEWFSKVRFENNGLRVNIPLIHKKNDEYDVFFIFYGTNISDPDLFTYRLSVQVMESVGVKVSDFYLVYINKNYVFEDSLDVNKLFIITDRFKKDRYIDLIRKKEVDYEEIIYRIDHSSIEDYFPQKKRICHGKNECPHYYKCFSEEKSIPDNSILTLVSSQYKSDMYKRGIRYLRDCETDKLEGSSAQYAQIMADKNGGLFVDKLGLRSFLDSFKDDTISFIDFEWDTYLVPAYRGMKPLDVVCFEFALYYLDGNGHLEHRTFMSTQDCRRDFVEALIMYLPKRGPILAYNAIGAESLRIKELSEWFPEYKKELDDINSRFVDLSIPFMRGMVYDTRMRGVYSLKKLVSIVSDYSYKELNIDNGLEAVYSWRNADKGLEDNRQIFEDLEKYCSLDAYGLILVYKWLLELVACK